MHNYTRILLLPAWTPLCSRCGHYFRLVWPRCVRLPAVRFESSGYYVLWLTLSLSLAFTSNNTLLAAQYHPIAELETSSMHSGVYLLTSRFCSYSMLAVLIYSRQGYAQLSASLLETLSRIACAMKTPINSSYIVGCKNSFSSQIVPLVFTISWDVRKMHKIQKMMVFLRVE